MIPQERSPAPAWYEQLCKERVAAPGTAPRPGRAALPRIVYADTPGIRAYVRSVRYRKYRPYVLAAVLTYVIARRLSR